MNYRRIYEEFISDRRSKDHLLQKQDVERHHVEPRCQGGSNNPNNLIDLCYSDHLFAHLLLAKIYGGPLVVAFILMLGIEKYRGRDSRSKYSALRKEHASHMSRITKERMAVPETLEAMRIVSKIRMSDPARRAAHSKAMTGRKRSLESCLKQGKTIKTLGRKDSLETRERKRLASLKSSARPEVKEKQRLAKLGNKFGLGKVWSPEERAKQSKLMAEVYLRKKSCETI